MTSSTYTLVNILLLRLPGLREFLFYIQYFYNLQVVPELESALCGEKGNCNLNGNCTPCSRSISLDRDINAKPG